MKIYFLIVAILYFVAAQAQSHTIIQSYHGEVKLLDGDQIQVTVNTSQYGPRKTLSGSACYASGRSAAPDFDGSFIASGAEATRYSFEDSFGNKGFATLTYKKNGLYFEVTIKDLKDPRCLPLYGKIKFSK
jgi:hypothetical protein